MNIQTRQINYSWVELVISDGGTTIERDVTEADAEWIIEQLSDAIRDISTLINDKAEVVE